MVFFLLRVYFARREDDFCEKRCYGISLRETKLQEALLNTPSLLAIIFRQTTSAATLTASDDFSLSVDYIGCHSY
jgi:hypothetical protein